MIFKFRPDERKMPVLDGRSLRRRHLPGALDELVSHGLPLSIVYLSRGTNTVGTSSHWNGDDGQSGWRILTTDRDE
jgi:hypothetical protein